MWISLDNNFTFFLTFLWLEVIPLIDLILLINLNKNNWSVANVHFITLIIVSPNRKSFEFKIVWLILNTKDFFLFSKCNTQQQYCPCKRNTISIINFIVCSQTDYRFYQNYVKNFLIIFYQCTCVLL